MSDQKFELKRGATSINEEARRILDISRDEYAFISYVHYRQADSRQAKPGWCSDEKDEIAWFVGVSRQALQKMALRMSAKDLIEISGYRGIFRTTPKWVDTENLCKESLHRKINLCKESLHNDVKKVYTESGFHVNKVSETNNVSKIDKKEKENKREEITPLSENGKTEFTLHTPDQIENTFVHVVEQVSLEEKTALDKTSSAAPGENKENPALQNAGTFEASVIPHNLPPTKKNRKTKPEDRTAAVCAEMKTEKDVDFFHAIHAAWGEWLDYKRREKKGTYKTSKTEAATITALARTVNYDPVAGRAAIEHSIAHTYQGIYPPKDAAPTKPAAERYSIDDCPQAQTPGELRDELSRFYNTHKALLSEAQQLAETNYGPDRLRSIVTDFCGNRISKGRSGETFGQHHAALGAWLKRQKQFDTKNDGPKHAGPQGRQLFSAAPVNYSLD